MIVLLPVKMRMEIINTITMMTTMTIFLPRCKLSGGMPGSVEPLYGCAQQLTAACDQLVAAAHPINEVSALAESDL